MHTTTTRDAPPSLGNIALVLFPIPSSLSLSRLETKAAAKNSAAVRLEFRSFHSPTLPPPQTLKSPPPPLSHAPEAYISDVEGQTTKGRTKHGEWIRSAHRRPGRISARVTAHPGGFGLQNDIDTYSVAYVHELYKIRIRGRLTRLYRREPTHPLERERERDHPSFVAQNQLIVHCEHSGMMICSRYVSVPSRLSLSRCRLVFSSF